MDWMTHVELYGIVDESPWPDLTSLCARYDQITSPGKYSPSKTPTITRGAWQYNLDMVCNAGEVVPGPENEYKLPSRWKKGGPGKAQRDDARNWCKERCWCVDSWTNFAQAATNAVGEDGKVVVQKVKEYFDNEMVRAKAEREEQIRLWRLRHDQRIIPTNWYKDRGPRGRDQNLVNDPGREPDRGHIS
ncbi:MAG: hypothetical protein M1825_003555 [Sarcosagium campestre]|nr:MAG: hypothetical protein M1825_003555 [Sarcosagium campestre]